jgi:hypothetical protein
LRHCHRDSSIVLPTFSPSLLETNVAEPETPAAGPEAWCTSGKEVLHCTGNLPRLCDCSNSDSKCRVVAPSCLTTDLVNFSTMSSTESHCCEPAATSFSVEIQIYYRRMTRFSELQMDYTFSQTSSFVEQRAELGPSGGPQESSRLGQKIEPLNCYMSPKAHCLLTSTVCLFQ